MYAAVHVYPGLVTSYKVPEKYGHVQMVTLYIICIYSTLKKADIELFNQIY